MIARLFTDIVAKLTTPVLTVACVGLAALALAQTLILVRSEGELKSVRATLAASQTDLTTERTTTARLQGVIDQAQSRREREAVDAARDVAAIQTQCQAQIKNARESSRAIAEMTDARCPTQSPNSRGIIGADRLRNAAGQSGRSPPRAPDH